MATFVVQGRWTQQGIRDVRMSPIRLSVISSLAESLDAKLEQFYLVSGEFNVLAVFSAPDNMTMMILVLAFESTGDVRVRLSLTITRSEYVDLIGGMT